MMIGFTIFQVREVTPNGRADQAGLKPGDCILQADGKDLLGLPVSICYFLISNLRQLYYYFAQEYIQRESKQHSFLKKN